MLSGSMTAAARELYTSQPNISRLISQLEMETGLTLFERKFGRLQATPEANAFYGDVKRAFVGLSDLKKSAQSIKKLGTGILRIAAVPSMALTLVPTVIRDFSEIFPDVRVSMHFNDSMTVSQWTASGYCDVGITSYVLDSPGVEVELMRTVAGVCVLPPDHRLAKGRRALTPKDLRGERFISLSYGDRRPIDEAFTASGEDDRLLAYESPYAAAVCQMVGLGMGVSVVNPIVATSYLHTGIAVRKFLPTIPFSTHLLFPMQHPSSQLTLAFAKLFKQHIDRAV